MINGEGKPSIENITSQNEDEIKIIQSLIHKLPNFTAPYHKGDTVSVSYLIEVPLFNLFEK